MALYCTQCVKLGYVDVTCLEVCCEHTGCENSYSPEKSTESTRTRSISSASNASSEGSAWSKSVGKMETQQIDAVYSHLYVMRKADVPWCVSNHDCNLCSKSAFQGLGMSCKECSGMICRDCFAQVMVVRLNIEDFKTICYGCPWCPQDILRVDVVAMEE